MQRLQQRLSSQLQAVCVTLEALAGTPLTLAAAMAPCPGLLASRGSCGARFAGLPPPLPALLLHAGTGAGSRVLTSTATTSSSVRWRQQLQVRSSSPRGVRSFAIASTSSGSKEKSKWVCQECGAEYLQSQGKCRACNTWHSVVEERQAPAAAAGSGGTAAAKALLGTSGSRRAASRRSATAAAGVAGAPGVRSSSSYYDDPSDTAAAAYSYADDDEGAALEGDEGSGSASAAALFARLQASRAGGWVARESEAAGATSGPVRLSDMVFSARELRLPLFGATGQEVARVLGGGVMPGSVVLLGGEPGQGKSTLLLQVAALIAHSCSAAAAAAAPGSLGAVSNGPDDGQQEGEKEEDVPLSVRRAAAAAAANGSSTAFVRSARRDVSADDSAGDWLAEAAAEAAAAAASGGSGLQVPRHCVGRPVLYFTAEESAQQVWDRANRLGLISSSSSGGSSSSRPGGGTAPPLDVRLMCESDVERIGATLVEQQPAAAIIDSIQTMRLAQLPSRPGTVTQVRESAACLLAVAKELGCTLFLVGHVNKAGDLAGPKHLEHMVDVVLSLTGVERGELRLLRATKNRHGRQGEVGIFEMRSSGMSAVANAAALFAPSAVDDGSASSTSSSSSGARVGTAIAVIQDGGRPLPLEIQALAVPRVQEVTPAAAAAAAAAGEDEDGYADEGASSGSNSWEGEEEEEGEWGSSGSSDGEDPTSSSGSMLGAGLMRGGPAGGGGASGGRQSRQQRGQRGSSSSSSGGSGGDPGGGGGSTRELLPLFRHPVGVADRQRLGMLLELMTHYTPIKTHMFNLFINVVAGVTIPRNETLADLAVLAAIASSVLNTPLPPGTALMGECGLAGELRLGQHKLQGRVSELAKLGFSQVIIPQAASTLDLSPADLRGMRVVRAPTLRAALEHCFGAATLQRAGRPVVVADNLNRRGGGGGGRQRRTSTAAADADGGGGDGNGAAVVRAQQRRSRRSRAE